MCLGIPAKVVDMDGGHPDLAYADVAGERRQINMGLIADGEVVVGDWVVIHMGFAMERISPEAAADAIAVLDTLGPNADRALDTGAGAPPW